MLFIEIIHFYYEKHTTHTNVLCGQNVEFFLALRQVVHIVTTGLRGLIQFNFNPVEKRIIFSLFTEPSVSSGSIAYRGTGYERNVSAEAFVPV
jgi:hypothetical protein